MRQRLGREWLFYTEWSGLSSPTGSHGDNGPQGPRSADMQACSRDRKEAEGPASQQARWKTRPAGKAGPVS